MVKLEWPLQWDNNMAVSKSLEHIHPSPTYWWSYTEKQTYFKNLVSFYSQEKNLVSNIRTPKVN